MHKLLISAFSLIIAGGIFLSLKHGLGPKPVPQINPSLFAKPEEIGAVVYRRLRQVIKENHIIVLGNFPLIHNYDQIWQGFIRTAVADGVKIKTILQQPELKAMEHIGDIPVKLVRATEDTGTIRDELLAAADGETIIIYTVPNFSSHLLASSPLVKLRSELKRPILSLTTLAFVLKKEKLADLQPPCPDGAVALTDLSPLGCASANISRKFFRKKYEEKDLMAAMEMHGALDYLLFVHDAAVTSHGP